MGGASFEAYALEITTWPEGIVEQQLRPYLGKIRTFDGNGGKKGTAYTQEDLDEDLAVVDEILELIRLHIFEDKEVMRAWDFSQAGAPKDYTEKGGPPEIHETEGEVGSEREATRPPSSTLSPGKVTYNLGGRRKEKIQPALMAILEATAAELNAHEKLTPFSIQIYSGGQPSQAEAGYKHGADRTGSARHDHGWAADIRCFKDGRRLSCWNASNAEIRVVIVRALLKNGIHSIGIGKPDSGYMNGNIHVDIATGRPMHSGKPIPRVCWGGGGASANTPAWLKNIYVQ